nr:UDP-glycosyltransferase [Nicotiana tabacum]
MFPFMSKGHTIPFFDLARLLLNRGIISMITIFLGWTLDSANKFGIPRLSYHTISPFATCMGRSSSSLLRTELSDNERFTDPDISWIKITRNDFDSPLREREQKGPFFQFVMESIIATSKSYGVLFNSFYELECISVDYFNIRCSPRAWCIGPSCEQQKAHLVKCLEKPYSHIMKWLDGMLQQRKPVLYVAFGTQAQISPEQFKEIKIGLEKSQFNFLWVVRRNTIADDNGIGFEFEDRVKNKGLVVTEWVDQREILSHESVQGFLSHCGWNSIIESICAKVPILAWHMMAEQHLNARLVVEEIKIGIRVET